MKLGFDNDKYLRLQAQHITERLAQFGGKLYLEFGGKLFDDYHASRVLPGFQPDSKIRMLQQLKDDVEIVIAINAGDIEKNKMPGRPGHHLRRGRAAADRRIPGHRASMWAAWSSPSTPASPRRTPSCKRLDASWACRCYQPLPHRRLSLRRGPHRQRRGLWQERLHRDHAPPGGGHRPRPGQRQDGHLPVASSITSTSGASRRATPSSRPSPSGTCP